MQHRGRGRRGQTQRDGEEEKGGKWRKITHAAVMGSDGTHFGCCSRSASATSEDCAVQQQREGGGRGGRSWEGEAGDVKSFELFRRPLHRM